MRYLLDTNIIIAALKGRGEVVARLERTPAADLLLSIVVLGELEFGAEKSAQTERNRTRLAELAQRLPLASVDAETSRCYGRIRSELERQGKPIGANDTWIAAQALALGAVLVTDNVDEFSRVPGLKLENWLDRR
ncbi:MAG: type II toxin-antitoxin system VapC family toxin [Rhodocyclaceae bacterium]|nr:type II toxin-antitoxin system VapC family toxin [Rhodocyclaceae bacterium]